MNVHGAKHTETVIQPSLIGPQILESNFDDYGVDLANLSDGFLTIIFHGETADVGWDLWLIVIEMKEDEGDFEREPLAIDLLNPDFVARNNSEYFCVGYPTGSSADGRHHEWIWKTWSLVKPYKRLPDLQITELAVTDLGQSLVFEIFDGFLYAVSTQTHEVEEPEWISYYHCFRFPLNNPRPDKLERDKIWRRQHREGPINDLWADLKLYRDEATGELQIVEARKEWKEGSSSQSRTWYRHSLAKAFAAQDDLNACCADSIEDVEESEDMTNTDANTQPTQPTMASDVDPPFLFSTPPIDKPPPHERLETNTHPEYSKSSPPPPIINSSILAKSKYRTYIPSASTFIDLVIDDSMVGMNNKTWAQQLFFRMGSRRLASPLGSDGLIHEYMIDNKTELPVENSEERFVDLGVKLWPPPTAPKSLIDLLNGGSRWDDDGKQHRTFGDITAMADERSVVYLVKAKGASGDGWGRLILVNFDENIDFSHEHFTPRFLDLHSDGQARNDDEVVIEGPRRAEANLRASKCSSVQSDADDDDGDEDEDVIMEDAYVESADNHLESWEMFDEDEEVEFCWYKEEIALWTEICEGFVFEQS